MHVAAAVIWMAVAFVACYTLHLSVMSDGAATDANSALAIRLELEARRPERGRHLDD